MLFFYEQTKFEISLAIFPEFHYVLLGICIKIENKRSIQLNIHSTYL